MKRALPLMAASVLVYVCLLSLPARAASYPSVFLPESASYLALPDLPDVPLLRLEDGRDESGAAIKRAFFPTQADRVFAVLGARLEPMLMSDDCLSAVCTIPSASAFRGVLIYFGRASIRYGVSGVPRSVEWTDERDLFYTGQPVERSVVHWDNTVLSAGQEQFQIWHVSSVTVDYASGAKIAQAAARYQADREQTLIDYEITYAPKNQGRYRIHYGQGDHLIAGEYMDGEVHLRNGNGRHFWDETWYDAESGRLSDQKGLLAFSSFSSPRVRTMQ